MKSLDRFRLHINCLGLLLVGCSSSADPEKPSAAVSMPPQVSEEPPLDSQEHNFGTILAEGQILTHVFKLANASAKPMRVVNAVAQAPCCSRFESVPRVVPAYSDAPIKVNLKAGAVSAEKVVTFSLRPIHLPPPCTGSHSERAYLVRASSCPVTTIA